MDWPSVAIIVVNWNGLADTLACLKSLDRIDYPSHTILVVDNGSTDGSPAAIRAAYPAVRLFEAGRNLGYVGGNNLGLEQARALGADYSLLLNNDTEVAPDFLQQLVLAVTEPTVGLAGPLIYYHSQPQVIWSAGGAIDWRRGRSRMIGEGEIDQGQYGDEPRPVDFVTGCALLVKMTVVEQVGPLDERFFAYFEETEWCVRATRAGYRALIVPLAKIWHKITPEARFASASLAYYLTRNRLLFLKLTGADWRPWLYTLCLDYARTILSYAIQPKWRHKKASRQAMIQGIMDFVYQRWGPMPS